MKKKQDELVSYWEKQLREGLAYREKYGHPQDWKRYLDYYRAEWASDIIPVNRIFSYGRSLIPRVYFRSPAITIVPMRPEFAPSAKVLEAVDNWLITEIGLKDVLKRACLHSYLTGVGLLKLGYDSEFGFIPQQAILPDSETLTQESTSEPRKIEYRVDVKPGMPWVLDVPSYDIITPWGYNTLNSLPWICHVVMRPLEDVKQDQKYRNTKDLKGGFRVDRKYPSMWGSRGGTDFTRLYEVRDVKHKRLIVLCEKQVLLDEEDELQVEGLPYECIQFNPDLEHFWAISDVKVVQEQQKELNEIRTQASKHRRLALVRFLYSKGTLTPDQVAQMLSEDVPVALELDHDNPATAVSTLQAHVPPDLWREAQEVLADFRETLGFSRNQAGEFVTPITPRTATEVSAVREATELRAEERRDIVADVFTNIIRKLNQFIFKFWTTERVTPIIGRDGAQHWIRFTGEELMGEYAYTVYPETGLPVSRNIRFRQATELFNMLRNDPLIDQVGLRKLVLGQISWVDPTWSSLVREPGPPEGVPPAPEGVPPAPGVQPLGADQYPEERPQAQRMAELAETGAL